MATDEATLKAAIFRGDVARVQELLDAGLVDAKRPSRGRTVLSEAIACPVWSERDPIVVALLESGVDPNGRDGDGKTPLMNAAIGGYALLVARLVAAGASLESEDNDGITALGYAASCGHDWIVEVLLRYGAKVDSAPSSGLTPLSCAAMNAQARTTRLLIRAGARLETTDTNGTTALMHAGRANSGDVVKVLAEEGANLYVRNKKGQSVLIEAIVARRMDTVSAIRRFDGFEIARALVADSTVDGRRACGVCKKALGGSIRDVQAHFRTEHQFELSHSEVRRLMTEPLEKNRTHIGGSTFGVSGGLPSLGKRR